MLRVCNYFDSQLRIPIPSDNPSAADKPLEMLRKAQDNPWSERKAMTPEEMLVWYGKVLDAVRMRYRKLQRFARYVFRNDTGEADLPGA
jgi:mitogen-activated protein kinase kinase kinase